MQCPECEGPAKKFGKARGKQRYRCLACEKTFYDSNEKAKEELPRLKIARKTVEKIFIKPKPSNVFDEESTFAFEEPEKPWSIWDEPGYVRMPDTDI